jgi:xylose isomerase
MVTCCPLIDGHNYHFEVDHLSQWSWLEEGIACGARHRTDIRLALEYKLNESRNFSILSDIGRTLYLCERIGLPHVGVTLDIGHALIARESPAQALCLAARAGKLFYVHFNDNSRDWDWDMLPGSVNPWDFLETLYYLERHSWEGWVSYDVVTRGGLVESMQASIWLVESGLALVHKIGVQNPTAMIAEDSPARVYNRLPRSFL